MTVIPPFRWFAPFFVVIGLGVLGLSAQQTSVNETSIKRFTEWCEKRSDLPPATQHTVDQLLTIAGTQDCAI